MRVLFHGWLTYSYLHLSWSSDCQESVQIGSLTTLWHDHIAFIDDTACPGRKTAFSLTRMRWTVNLSLKSKLSFSNICQAGWVDVKLQVLLVFQKTVIIIKKLSKWKYTLWSYGWYPWNTLETSLVRLFTFSLNQTKKKNRHHSSINEWLINCTQANAINGSGACFQPRTTALPNSIDWNSYLATKLDG